MSPAYFPFFFLHNVTSNFLDVWWLSNILDLKAARARVHTSKIIMRIRALGVPFPFLFLFFRVHFGSCVDFRLCNLLCFLLLFWNCVFVVIFRVPFRMRKFRSTGLPTCLRNLRFVSVRFYTIPLIRTNH